MTHRLAFTSRAFLFLSLVGAVVAGQALVAQAASLAAVGAAAADDERFTLSVEPGAVKAGKEATVQVSVTAKTPWHLNLEFPTALKLNTANGVTYTKDSLKKGDAATLTEAALAFDVKLVAATPGAKELTGTLKFAICKAEACAPVTQEIKVSLNVTK